MSKIEVKEISEATSTIDISFIFGVFKHLNDAGKLSEFEDYLVKEGYMFTEIDSKVINHLKHFLVQNDELINDKTSKIITCIEPQKGGGCNPDRFCRPDQGVCWPAL